ncbi:MAG TPA: hypothetical protein VEI02_07060, partial [Planctomycetota bacterium]|nr:hypothetical protein [Planctomycetota bacterium]
ADDVPFGERLRRLADVRDGGGGLGRAARRRRVELWARRATQELDAAGNAVDAIADPEARAAARRELQGAWVEAAADVAPRLRHAGSADAGFVRWAVAMLDRVPRVRTDGVAVPPQDLPGLELAVETLKDALTASAMGATDLPFDPLFDGPAPEDLLRRAGMLLSALRDDAPPDDAATKARDAILERLRGRVRPGDVVYDQVVAALPAPAAFDALHPDAVQTLPLEALLDGWRRTGHMPFFEGLAARPDGVGAAAELLGDRRHAAVRHELAGALVRGGAPRPLAAAPLDALLELADDGGGRAFPDSEEPAEPDDVAAAAALEVATRAAEAPERLAAEAATRIGPGRALLVAAVASASSTSIPWRDDDGSAPHYADLEAARQGDSAAADRIRARLAALDPARERARRGDRSALLDALAAHATPLDVVRFGAPRPSARLRTAVLAWTDDALRGIMRRPPQDGSTPAPETPEDDGAEDRGSVAQCLALLPPGRIDAVREDAAAWWRSLQATASAPERLDAFRLIGAAQADVLAEFLRAPPLPSRRHGPEEVSAARTAVLRALDRTPERLDAAAPIVAACEDAAARRVFAELRTSATGRPATWVDADGRVVETSVADDPAARFAAIDARVRREGLAALDGLEPELRATWDEALLRRGAAWR